MTTDTELVLLSADCHIVEPPDLWTARVERKFRDRVPRLVKGEKFDWWCVEGNQSLGSIGNATHPGERFRLDRPHEIPVEGRWESVRPGGYDPHQAIVDMGLDGVYGAAMFPTAGVGGIWRTQDSELLDTICRTYNDWIADFCKPYPDRLKGVAMINLESVEEGVKELRRARKLGLTASLITIYPRRERQYHNAEYEPLWAAAQELDMPLCLHSGSHRDAQRMDGFDNSDPHDPVAIRICTQVYLLQRSLASMIWSGVFERYPALKIVSIENEAMWAAHWMYKMDIHHQDRGVVWPRFKGDLKPSDFFHRQIFLSFQEDWLAVRERSFIGIENLMWGSDYPHTEGTWPDSRRFVRTIFSEVPDDEVRKMTYDNAARVFGFNREPISG